MAVTTMATDANVSTPTGDAEQGLVPINFMIDVEPDGFFIKPGELCDWTSIEPIMQAVSSIRRQVLEATGHPMRVTWLFRLDPQISLTCGSPDWPLREFPALVEDAELHGDDIGAHVHPYRLNADGTSWVVDYGDQVWVDDCIESALDAYESALGRTCRSISMGNHWINDATVSLLERRGIQYELTTLSESFERGFSVNLGEFHGTEPDYSRLPRRPYRPSIEDFRIPDDSRTEGIWMIPLNTHFRQFDPPRWRTLGSRLYRKLRWLPPKTRRFLIREGIDSFRPSFDHIVDHAEVPYVTLSLRSAFFNSPQRVNLLRGCFDYFTTHPQAERFRFATPEETIRIVSAQPAPCSTIHRFAPATVQR